MSSKASLIPKRSARARAFGRSLSQSARTSTPFIFLRTGRWATCTTAPAPTIPILSGSVIALTPTRPPASVQALQLRPRIIRAEDLPVILSGAGAADGAPLAEPHAVPVAAALGHQPTHPPSGARDAQVERVAAENVAGAAAQHLAHLGSVHLHVGAGERDRQLPDPARPGARDDADVAHGVHLGGRHPHDGRQRLSKHGQQRVPGPLLTPAESGRDAAVG